MIDNVCEWAVCEEVKKKGKVIGFITICEQLSEECHTNHLDKRNCKDWKENKQFLKYRK